jgi:hypothetical protein
VPFKNLPLKLKLSSTNFDESVFDAAFVRCQRR